MDEIQVTVIIPAYNPGSYIIKAVESVLAQQDMENCMEVLVIDDGSQTPVEETLFEQINDPRLTVVRSVQNQGVAETRNIGIRGARGKYVAFLDADDWWTPDKLKQQLALLEKTDAVLCCSARAICHEDGKKTGRIIEVPEQITYQMMLRTNLIPCGSVVMKTEVAREFYMCHPELHEDYILWLQVLKKYHQAIGINKPLLNCRLSRGGKSRNKLKSARMHYGVYRYVGIGKIKSIYYLCCYLWYGVKKYYG